MIKKSITTPWKIINELLRYFIIPLVRVQFLISEVKFPQKTKIFGIPKILKHRGSTILFKDGLQLRSNLLSNPLGPNHPVIICTWAPKAILSIGENFAMTGGTICSAEYVQIGNNVTVGANSTIVDTDFHPIAFPERQLDPQRAVTAPIIIEDDVFIGMNCLILKGVRLGKGCVVGAGSVVTHDIPSGMIAAGNPARVIKPIS